MPRERTPEELLLALDAANASTAEGRRLIDNLMLATYTKVKKELLGTAPLPTAKKEQWKSWVDLYVELHHKLRKQNERQKPLNSKISLFPGATSRRDQDYLDAIECIKKTRWNTPAEEVDHLLRWVAMQLLRHSFETAEQEEYWKDWLYVMKQPIRNLIFKRR
jgi:hypothetical protein